MSKARDKASVLIGCYHVTIGQSESTSLTSPVPRHFIASVRKLLNCISKWMYYFLTGEMYMSDATDGSRLLTLWSKCRFTFEPKIKQSIDKSYMISNRLIYKQSNNQLNQHLTKYVRPKFLIGAVFWLYVISRYFPLAFHSTSWQNTFVRSSITPQILYHFESIDHIILFPTANRIFSPEWSDECCWFLFIQMMVFYALFTF